MHNQCLKWPLQFANRNAHFLEHAFERLWSFEVHLTIEWEE